MYIFNYIIVTHLYSNCHIHVYSSVYFIFQATTWSHYSSAQQVFADQSTYTSAEAMGLLMC